MKKVRNVFDASFSSKIYILIQIRIILKYTVSHGCYLNFSTLSRCTVCDGYLDVEDDNLGLEPGGDGEGVGGITEHHPRRHAGLVRPGEQQGHVVTRIPGQ